MLPGIARGCVWSGRGTGHTASVQSVNCVPVESWNQKGRSVATLVGPTALSAAPAGVPNNGTETPTSNAAAPRTAPTRVRTERTRICITPAAMDGETPSAPRAATPPPRWLNDFKTTPNLGVPRAVSCPARAETRGPGGFFEGRRDLAAEVWERWGYEMVTNDGASMRAADRGS